MRLKDRVAIITGGAKGIGGTIATTYHREGARLVIPDIDGDALAEKEREIRSLGGNILPLELDISKPENVDRLISETIDRFGRLDILVNNAAWASYGPFTDTTLENWQKTLDVTLTAYFLCAQAAARQMQTRSGGKIIHICSIASQSGVHRTTAYTASKGGILALTRVMAIELAAHNIQVNCINPGFIMTPLVQRILTEKDRQDREAVIPAGRYGTPEDVAGPAVFLASDASDYVTGTSIVVDGGVTCASLWK
ncbi:MAG: SDR family NAD(P)-dependent oxidoreductase [Deltaproteobacteria bacterium]|jgi:NAD(P)-dependent dehydrogenase (short-subunit alcohol dehydrogenase family)